MEKKFSFLLRYTDIPSLIHMLKFKKLTLLDPVNWADRNDAFYMRKYKEKCGLTSLFALCFTETSETYHHWKIFAAGNSGVYIKFDRRGLEYVLGQIKEKLKESEELRYGVVQYREIKKLKGLKKEALPFSKRYPFRDEKEYRIIYGVSGEAEESKLEFKQFDLPLSCISRIALSPWLPTDLALALKEVLNSIIKKADIEVVHTTLLENKIWKKIGAAAV